MKRKTFYGIDDIYLIWHGEWADPELEYNGRLYNYYAIEDTLWNEFCDECKEKGIDPDENQGLFNDYVKSQADYIKDIIMYVLDGGEL